jgi:hypothetical protein
VADWIVLVSGYDPSVLKPLTTVEPGAEMLAGAMPMRITGLYALTFTDR